MDKLEPISCNQFARLVGAAKSTISQAIAENRLEAVDGKIDPAAPVNIDYAERRIEFLKSKGRPAPAWASGDRGQNPPRRGRPRLKKAEPKPKPTKKAARPKPKPKPRQKSIMKPSPPAPRSTIPKRPLTPTPLEQYGVFSNGNGEPQKKPLQPELPAPPSTPEAPPAPAPEPKPEGKRNDTSVYRETQKADRDMKIARLQEQRLKLAEKNGSLVSTAMVEAMIRRASATLADHFKTFGERNASALIAAVHRGEGEGAIADRLRVEIDRGVDAYLKTMSREIEMLGAK